MVNIINSNQQSENNEKMEYRFGDLIIRPGSVPDTPPESKPRFPKYNSPNRFYRAICKVCYISEQNTIFTPCGHISTCHQCAVSSPNCRKCQVPIKKYICYCF